MHKILRFFACSAEESNPKMQSSDSTIQSSNEETIADFSHVKELPDDDRPCSSTWSRSDCSRKTPSTLNSSRLSHTSHDLSMNRLAPVKQWLCDLKVDVENECIVFLKYKKFPKPTLEDGDPEARKLQNLASAAISAATKLLVRAEKFDQHFDSICKQLLEVENVRIRRDLIQVIEDDAYTFSTELGASPPRRIHKGSLRKIKEQLETMKMDIETAIESHLDLYIERILTGLEESIAEDQTAARGTISALIALGMAGIRAGRSIARCYGVRNLLGLLLSYNVMSDVRVSALRALACVCSSAEAIAAFAEEDGPKIIADILANQKLPEREKTEATALIVRISALGPNAQCLSHLAMFADSLVRDLTELAERTSYLNTVLLVTVALNSLSANRKFVRRIVKYDTVQILIKCVKRLGAGNVRLMEQVTSLAGELESAILRRPDTVM